MVTHLQPLSLAASVVKESKYIGLGLVVSQDQGKVHSRPLRIEMRGLTATSPEEELEPESMGPVTANSCFAAPKPSDSLLSPRRVVPTVSALFEERERQRAREKARETHRSPSSANASTRDAQVSRLRLDARDVPRDASTTTLEKRDHLLADTRDAFLQVPSRVASASDPFHRVFLRLPSVPL
jgi:hypothetical protein